MFGCCGRLMPYTETDIKTKSIPEQKVTELLASHLFIRLNKHPLFPVFTTLSGR